MTTDYHRVKVVTSFDELVSTPMNRGINAVCWERSLTGDFDEIISAFGSVSEITSIEEDDLETLPLSPQGVEARAHLINDLSLLKEAGLSPNLDCIPAYPRDPDAGPVPTDVYSFHADSATVIADTYLCSYTVACSEGLKNEEAIRRVDVPETRAKLRALYGGADDEGFLAYLKKHFFDLHYQAQPQAKPYSFGLFNLWRIATECPGSPVPPCIHRAPTTTPNQASRLLLIS